MQLIPRLYDAETGTVKVGGVDVRDYNLDVLRREVSMVLQKNVLFSGTILDNLRWGDPNATEEAVERVAEAASSMKLSPEAVQRILDAFDNIIEAINRMIEWAAQAIRTLADFFGETLDNFILRRAPPKWRHYALHAKRARVRKKYRNRIRRAFFAALASEGGGSS